MLTTKQTQDLLDLKDKLQYYHITLEEGYCSLYNFLSDCWLEEELQDYIDTSTAEELALQQLEEWWLARLYYFMWDVNWWTAEVVRIDWYGNCEEVSTDDLIDVIDDVIDNHWADIDDDED